jgi:hypothetical protein
MHKIIIRLPAQRDYAGQLELQGPGGRTLAGPFDVCARADDAVARNHQNPGRNPLLPFGDVPLGGYRVVQILDSGAGTPYPAEEFGSAGIVLLQPQSGDAILADANGRFGFFIQGGRLSRKGALRPTEGSLRLADRDLRSLLSALRKLGPVDCACVAVRLTSLRRKVPVAPSQGAVADPSARDPEIPGVTRRSWLRTVILSGASVAVPGGLSFTVEAAAAVPVGDYSPAAAAPDVSAPATGAMAEPQQPPMQSDGAVAPSSSGSENPQAKRQPEGQPPNDTTPGSRVQ